jgi:hypothetical protein
MDRYNAKSLGLPVALYDPLARYEKIKNDFWRDGRARGGRVSRIANGREREGR